MKLWDWLVDMCIWHESTLPFEDDDTTEYTLEKPIVLKPTEYIESIEIVESEEDEDLI